MFDILFHNKYFVYIHSETIDNQNNKNIPKNVRYGWAETKTFWDGIGTLDAKYPDLLRILTARPSTPGSFENTQQVKQFMLSPTFVPLSQSYPIYSVNPDAKFDLNKIMDALDSKRKEILSEHVDENVLTIPVLKIKNIDKTMQWLGARLAHSLLIGRVFTMAFTGSSNTAGHDNQFASTYPIQLQSRLRTLWAAIGVDGAGINIRNVAVGGSPKTDTMAWHIHARSSETVAYPFNDVNILNSGAFWRNEDVIFWESFMNDGGKPPHIATEVQLRSTALLNAIFGAMNSIDSLGGDKCSDRYDLNWKKLRPPKHLGSSRDSLFGDFSSKYGNDMGLLEMDFGTFVQAVCKHSPKYSPMKINWHPNSRGHRCEADIYAYTLLTAAYNFINKNSKTINDKADKGQMKELDEYLLQESGNWGEKYIQSIEKQDFSLFPAPKYCAPYCGKTIAPFALKASEPNEWDVGFRLEDYIIYDYTKMNETTTMLSSVEGIKDFKIPDRNSRFSTEKLLHSFGWDFVFNEKNPAHFPQDRTGKIGAMDRKRTISANEDVWRNRYLEFLQKNYPNDAEAYDQTLGKKNKKNKDAQATARAILGKYPEEFGDYILKNNFDVKVAFMVPKIGNNSILAFCDEGQRLFYGAKNKNKLLDGALSIGLNIERIDGNKKDKQYNYNFDKRVTEQRDCMTYQRGCTFHDIPPGKYILRFYPMNMSVDNIPSLVQIIAF